jgi:hypothetical protein
MLANPITAILVGITVAVGALYIAWKDNWFNMQAYVTGAINAIIAAVTQLKELLSGFGSGITELFKGIFSMDASQINSAIETFKKSFQSYGNQITAAFQKGFEERTQKTKEQGKEEIAIAQETAAGVYKAYSGKQAEAEKKRSEENKKIQEENKKWSEELLKIDKENEIEKYRVQKEIQEMEAEDRKKKQADMTSNVNMGLGAANSVLQGKEGATSLIAMGAGKIADSFLPGIGAAVGPLVTELAKGPENAKLMIRQFIDAVPDIIVNIVEALAASADVIIEKLVDAFLIEGGLERIVSAQLRAYPKVSYAMANGMMEALGNMIEAVSKRFGISAGANISESLSAKVLMEKITEGFNKIFDKFQIVSSGFFEQAGQGIANFFTSIGDFFTNQIPEMIKSGMAVALDSMKLILQGNIEEAFRNVFDWFNSFMPDSVASAFKKVFNFFMNLYQPIFNAFSCVFNFFGNLSNTVYNAFANVGEQILAPIREFFDNFKVGGGGGSAVDKIGSFFGKATGGFIKPLYASTGLMVPRGSDIVPTMLSKGEHVTNSRSANANRSLLNQINSAGGPIGNQTLELKIKGDDEFGRMIEKMLIKSNALKTLSFSLDYGRG